jgi:hypothetical protein
MKLSLSVHSFIAQFHKEHITFNFHIYLSSNVSCNETITSFVQVSWDFIDFVIVPVEFHGDETLLTSLLIIKCQVNKTDDVAYF